MSCRAYAKVNLSLEVIGRRPDGYHDLASLFQTIDLHDTLLASPSDQLSLECDDPSLAGPDNLAWRAALLLRQRAGVREGARLELRKGIPVAAGLGGGSADAAAALLALVRLWNLDLTRADLIDLAAGLGADVPYFLYGGTALARGKGEVLRQLPQAPPRWLVLLCPPLSLPSKTASMYALLTPELYDRGEATRAAAEAIAGGRFPDEKLLVNTFAKVADGAFPGLAAARASLARATGGRPAHLTGAGPALFVLFEERGEAERALVGLDAAAGRAYLARTGDWRCAPEVAVSKEA